MDLMKMGCRCAIAVLLVLFPTPLIWSQTEALSQPDSSLSQSPDRTVTLSLSEVIQVVLQSNRELKNAQLDRIVQKQELKEAESVFNPRFAPSVNLGITSGGLSGGTGAISTPTLGTSTSRSTTTSAPSVSSSGLGRTVNLNDQTSFNRNAQVQAQLQTRIGTQVTVLGAPLSDFPLSITMIQPLLRGFGKTVNEAPVQVARLTNTKGELSLQQTLINKVTETISAYRDLYQRQEAVRIQETSLTNQRYQLQVTTALVQAGRRARADLVDIEQQLANSERQLIEAKNQLILANSALLRLMDTQETYSIRVTPESIETLIQAAIARSQNFEPDTLLETAYQQRPDYLQAKLDIETEQLNLIGAQDRTRWGLDLQSITSVGTSTQTAASLVLSREFGNVSLETEVRRRQVGVQKNTNRLNQLTLNIKTQLADQLQTIRALQTQIVAAQQASQLAQRQLAIAQERFKRGKTSIFEVTQKEETLTNALNSELTTKLNFLIAIAELDRILGITLDNWVPALKHEKMMPQAAPPQTRQPDQSKGMGE